MNNLKMIAEHHAPYIWGGTDVKTGLDCSGYIWAAARLIFPVTRTTAADMAAGFRGWVGITLANGLRYADEGDLPFYDWGSNRIKHVGATVRDPASGDPSLLHASSSRNRTVMVPLQGVLGKPKLVRRLNFGSAVQK